VLRVHAAFARVKARLEALRPDAIVMVAGDHVEGFFLSGVPALAVYVGTECSGTFGHYRYTFPIHEPLARHVVEQGIERGFDLLYTQEAKLDYAFFIPLHFTMPAPAVPIVPVHVNVYLPPQPTPGRCYAWGRTLGDILRARPERLVLMASGGMSHFPGTDRYANPDIGWDREMLSELVNESPEIAADASASEVQRVGGRR
jgi:aromatic ring-opening dioxygenase catalytic subunit (LigB family)